LSQEENLPNRPGRGVTWREYDLQRKQLISSFRRDLDKYESNRNKIEEAESYAFKEFDNIETLVNTHNQIGRIITSVLPDFSYQEMQYSEFSPVRFALQAIASDKKKNEVFVAVTLSFIIVFQMLFVFLLVGKSEKGVNREVLLNKVMKKVEQGDLKEAINDIFEEVENNNLQIDQDRLLLLASQIKHLRNQKIHGTIDENFAIKEINRLSKELIDLMEPQGQHS